MFNSKIIFLALIFIYSTISFGRASNLQKYAPKKFFCENSLCNYVDFQKATYNITYDLLKRSSYVESTIEFISEGEGMPIFDLVPSIKNGKVKVDGKEVDVLTFKDADGVSTLRAAKILLSEGPHELKIIHEIDRGFIVDEKGLRAAFWMTDLSDRGYLERYLPTNLEFDQYQININLELKNYTGKQDVFTNGNVQQISNNKWKITYPKFYTCSSLFFHTVPKNTYPISKFEFSSISGKIIPVTIYVKKESQLEAFKRETIKVVKEYERDFGPWPHERIIIYGAGSGGMEYSGATMTSLRALGHELNHSYFARGIMPSNGNTGWIDEAIASWRDDGSKMARRASPPSSGLGAHSQYRRTTDYGAYSKGARFMEVLNLLFKNKGGLKSFLASLVETKMYQSINVMEFKKLAEDFHGNNLDTIFNKTIFGKGPRWVSEKENPYHPILTQKQLDKLL